MQPLFPPSSNYSSLAYVFGKTMRASDRRLVYSFGSSKCLRIAPQYVLGCANGIIQASNSRSTWLRRLHDMIPSLYGVTTT